MAGHIGDVVGAVDHPVGVDQEAVPAREPAELVAGVTGDAVRLGRRPVGGEQSERELLRVGELEVLGRRVERRAEDGDPEFIESIGPVTQGLAFDRSTGRRRLRVPPQQDPAATKVGQVEDVAVLIGEREAGGRLTGHQHGSESAIDDRPFDTTDCTGARPPRDFGMPEIRMFSSKPYDRAAFERANESFGFDLTFLSDRLSGETAQLGNGAEAVCAFVNDVVSADVLEQFAAAGTRCVALRCAGFNNVDLEAAERLGIDVVRVPAYSPNAVAEHTLALILSLNRNIHRAHARVRDGNFSLDGLVGFDLAGKTAAVIGTGRIGAIVARLLWHLRCNVVAVDDYHDDHLVGLGVEYTDLDTALSRADVVTLNCPLTPETHHLIDHDAIARLRPGAMLVNTGRGALIDTAAAIDGLKSGQIGSLAIDVYEEEGDLFFEDRSTEVIGDDVFARLLTFPNVLITAHQAFLTHEALASIATTTLENVDAVLNDREGAHRVTTPD